MQKASSKQHLYAKTHETKITIDGIGLDRQKSRRVLNRARQA